MMHVLAVFGTRPEAIKMAPVVRQLAQRSGSFRVTTCVTSQHRQMLDQVLDLFEIRPDVDLNVMQPGQDLFDITSRVLVALRPVLDACRPDLCLVHGDTTTALAAALAAYYRQIPVGHVEAGLRTFQPYAPFPEEMNRSMISRIAAYHFAPTRSSRDNLLSEGIATERIAVTGNTVIDALQWCVNRQAADPQLTQRLTDGIEANGYKITDRRFVLVTGHRRENLGHGFENISRALVRIAELRPEVDIVYPVHLNPQVREVVQRVTHGTSNIFLIKPLDYELFCHLMLRCCLILTDSGGIQEEGPSLGKPVLVMRDVTERPEAVDAGTVRLVGTSIDRISDNVLALLDDEDRCLAMTRVGNPYGDGTAAVQIADFLAALPTHAAP